MFDWPAATQTSPTHTSSRRTASPAPLTVRLNGPPPLDGGRKRLKRPRSSAERSASSRQASANGEPKDAEAAYEHLGLTPPPERRTMGPPALFE